MARRSKAPKLRKNADHGNGKATNHDGVAATAEEIARLTPTNKELLELAKEFPPPAEWFEKDEEKPF